MSFKFHCPSCDQRISATVEAAGTVGVCPTCGQGFTVPNPPVARLSAETAPTSGVLHSLSKATAWWREQPRRSPLLRRTLKVLVGVAMVYSAIVALGGIVVSFVAWDSAQNGVAAVTRRAPPVLTVDPAVAAAANQQAAIRRVIKELEGAAPKQKASASNRDTRREFAAAVQAISIQGCPSDFAEAWVRYASAVQECVTVTNGQPESVEEQIFFGFLNGLNGELDGGTGRIMKERKEVIIRMDRALAEVAAIAARHGVH